MGLKKYARPILTAFPFLRRLLRRGTPTAFLGSQAYWEQRYAKGGTSGAGSSGKLAAFKADVINTFVSQHGLASVFELGCGDGNQLSLAQYPTYTGLDISSTAVTNCRQRFADDASKQFFVYDPGSFLDHLDEFSADLALSLDVIYHLTEDAVYETYMRHLFAAARRYVIVYSSNDEQITPTSHVRHRRFTDWIERHALGWRQIQHIDNPYPYDPQRPAETSVADFYIFERIE